MRRIGAAGMKPPIAMLANNRRPGNQNRLHRPIEFHRRLFGIPIIKLRPLFIRR